MTSPSDLFSEIDQRSVDRFFTALQKYAGAYAHSRFCYLAVRRDGRFQIEQARIFLEALPPERPTSHFASENVLAGRCLLKEQDVRELFGRFVSGSVGTADGELLFPPASNSKYTVVFHPLHKEGLKIQTRISTLSIFGAELPDDPATEIDWELMAAETPYNSLQDLRAEYQLFAAPPQRAHLEIVASNVLAIVGGRSALSGNSATVTLNLAKNLRSDLATLGYQIVGDARIRQRSTLDRADIEWTPIDDSCEGSAVFSVPSGSLVQCFASYDGIAQHYWWLIDSETSPNPRRAAYETFDSRLQILKDFLTNSSGRRRDARDLESAVAWLLWMHGFSPAHLGSTGKTQDAVDLIATTPSGHFVVIECTTGLLKAENKLAKLVERAEAVVRCLRSSGNHHLRVMPAIITSKSREEVRAEIEQAERLSVLVVTREDLDEAIGRSALPRNADVAYEEAERMIQAKLERYQTP